MLHIEYIHKRSKLFRIELSLVIVVALVVLVLVWQVLSVLNFFK